MAHTGHRKIEAQGQCGTFISEKSYKQLSLESISSLSRERQREV